MATLGIERWHEFSIASAPAGTPATSGLHIGFVAPSREHVDRFWQAGTAAGYRDDGEPGPRPEYGEDYYGGFLLDPEGNSAEAVHHDSLRAGGIVDHLWIRVADLAASKRFYESIASAAGFRRAHDSAERVSFDGATGSFSLVAGTPTESVQMAFPTSSASAAGRLVDPDGNSIALVARG